MSLTAKLHVDGKQFLVMVSHQEMHQTADENGLPISKPNRHFFTIVIEATSDDPFYEWLVNSRMKEVELVFSPITLNEKNRRITLLDTYCIFYKYHFSSTSLNSTTITVILSAGSVLENGNLIHQNHWWVTDPFPSKIDVISLAQTDKKKEPFRIELEASGRDIRNGKFGFDVIPDNYEKNCISNILKLKDEYKPLSEKILGKEYIPAWLSIRKGQTINLDLNWTKRSRAKKYNKIAFETHPDFSISPENLKNANEIQITCNENNDKPAQLLIKADDKTVGALNIFYPKPKIIDLKWFFVEITGEKKDYESLKNEISKTKLEAMLKKGFNPTLIDITVANDNAEIVDISEYKERLIYKDGGKKINILKQDSIVGQYIECGKQNNLFSKVAGAVNIKQRTNQKTINLFVFNRKCLNSANLPEDGGTFSSVGGLSPTGTGIAYMIFDGNGHMLDENFIHEIMHAFGLSHTFGKAIHRFKKGRTKNYMDYNNTKKSTYKWQWKKLREYSHLK